MRARRAVALAPITFAVGAACVPDYQFDGRESPDTGADVALDVFDHDVGAPPPSVDAGADGNADADVDAGDAVTLRTGLVLLLHMDEASWSGAGSVKDDSGQGNHGTPQGTATTTPSGKFGGAAALDGAGFVSVPDAPSLHPTTALTYAAWIYPTALGRFDGGDDYPGIISKRTDYGIDVAFTMFVWTGNTVWGDLQGSRFSSNATLQNDQWRHVAIVYDGTVADAGARAQLFVDGQRDGYHPADPSFGAHTATLTVGYLPQGPRDPDVKAYFTGRIDEVAVWNRALSEAEIGQLYAATGPL